jgi:hypothetical protein
MSEPRISRYALQVPSEYIAAMSDDRLKMLMEHLLHAQAYKCSSPQSEIRINTEGRASDDGSDGWSAKPVVPDDWFGSGNTSKRAHGASLLVGFVKSDGPLYRKNRADVRTGCPIYGFPFPPLRASDFACHLLNLMAGTF